MASDVKFVDVLDICLAGRGFDSSVLDSPYDRLPGAAQGVVRDAVWTLSRMSAGMHVDFRTDSASVATKIAYRYSTTTMWHFASTGVAGMDLYRWVNSSSVWRWVGTTVTNVFPESTNTLVDDLPPPESGTTSLYRLHLPLYNAPLSLSIGVEQGSSLEAACDTSSPAPIVHYGTSIAQGAVPSRPGHAFTNHVTRDLGRPVLNFGFSGNGFMETSVAKFLVQVRPAPALFVIDCLPNMQAPAVTNNTVPLVRYLRAAFPETPIVLAEGTDYGQLWLGGGVARAQKAKRAALRTQYEALLKARVGGLTYVNGSAFFQGVDSDFINPTVGGTHPTDLGMASMTQAWLSVYRGILGSGSRAAPAGERHPAAARPPAGRPAAPHDPKEDAACRRHLEDAERLERVVAGRHPAAAGRPMLGGVRWSPLSNYTVLGHAFPGQTPGPFNRLPSTAERTIRAKVWSLSEMSTGVRVAFVTNSSAVALNYTVGLAPEPLWHMPASGTSGADLFMFDPPSGRYRWVGTVEDLPKMETRNTVVTLVDGLPPTDTPRRFLLHLPLRNYPTQESFLAVDEGAAIGPDPQAPGPDHPGRRTIAWYGTSIEQGGVASRPGDTYTNIIARSTALPAHVDVFNFGFAGNGRDETNVSGILAGAPDIAVFVVDCLPNLDAELVTQRTGPVVRQVRGMLGPSVPIVLVQGTTYGDSWLGTHVFTQQQAKRTALQQQYEALQADGVKNLHLVTADGLFEPVWGSSRFETPTVGGTHPSSLGHREMAHTWEPKLAALLS